MPSGILQEIARAVGEGDGVEVPVLDSLHAVFGTQVRGVSQVGHVDEKGAFARMRGIVLFRSRSRDQISEFIRNTVISGTFPGADQNHALSGAGNHLSFGRKVKRVVSLWASPAVLAEILVDCVQGFSQWGNTSWIDGVHNAYQRVEKFLPTSEPKIDIAVILAVINSEKIMHSSENFFKEFDYVRTRMLLFWLYIRRY